MEYSGSKSFSNLTGIYISRASNTSGLENADIGLLALSFLRPGYYLSNDATGQSSLNLRGSYGLYWSAQSYASGTNLYANYLYFASTNVSPQNGYPRGYGYALRCLAR